jgi:DNA-binding NarL/FixJ family response regulator
MQKKVLMVDDDRNYLEMAKTCLNLQGGLDIETALSCNDAFAKMAEIKPDVIVSDFHMPVTNGFEFLKKLRDKGDSTPFIVFSMDEEKGIAVKAHQLGANGFIGKGGDPAVVFSKLKNCIESVARIELRFKENKNAKSKKIF